MITTMKAVKRRPKTGKKQNTRQKLKLVLIKSDKDEDDNDNHKNNGKDNEIRNNSEQIFHIYQTKLYTDTKCQGSFPTLQTEFCSEFHSIMNYVPLCYVNPLKGRKLSWKQVFT